VKKEINTISNTRSSISFLFSNEEISSEKEAVIGEFCATTTLPGFRKGKAPKNIILSKFLPNIEARTKATLLNKALEDVQKSTNELNLLAVVDYSSEDSEDGFLCKLIFDLRPNVKLPDYKNVTLTAFSEKVTKKEVGAEFDHIRKQHSNYNIVDREIKSGDYVKVNYEGFLEGGLAIVDAVPGHKIYGKQVNTWEEAGNVDVPGVQAVIQGVIGHKTGDRCEGEELFSEDFPVPELAGKKATYTFEILEVRERVDPDLNEEFFKQYGVDSVDSLKNRLSEYLANYKRRQGLLKQRDEIIYFLANSAKFELPESVIEREIQGLVQSFIEGQVKNGVSAKYFEGRIDEISKSLLPAAETRAKAGLVLDKIAEMEKIKIDNKDIEAMIFQDISVKKVDASQYVRELQSDRDKLIDLRTRTLRGKALDFLVEINSKEMAKIKKSQEQVKAEKEETSSDKAEDFKEIEPNLEEVAETEKS
jgi:trigger factor